jgi:hypothetical protein
MRTTEPTPKVSPQLVGNENNATVHLTLEGLQQTIRIS